MEVLKSFLNQNWVGTLIGIIGLVAACLFYRRSQVTPRPVYQTRGLGLVGVRDPALPGEVEIRFHGRAVPRVTRTHIVFWNAGRATIRREDVVTKDPPRLVFDKDTEVLNVRIAQTTREVIGLNVDVKADSGNEVVLSFDYLDCKDGALIEVLHTSENAHPQLLGTIRGIPKGIENLGRIQPYRTGRRGAEFTTFHFLRSRVGQLITLCAGLVVMSVGIWVLWSGPVRPELGEWSLILGGGFYVLLGSVLLWTDRLRFPKTLANHEVEW